MTQTDSVIKDARMAAAWISFAAVLLACVGGIGGIIAMFAISVAFGICMTLASIGVAAIIYGLVNVIMLLILLVGRSS